MEPTDATAADATRILPPELLSELEAICFRSPTEAARRERLAEMLARNTGYEAAIRGLLKSLDVLYPGDPEVRQIGPYRILAELGRGGFGEVYLAEQEVPVRRRVALKVLKLGMDSRLVLARFAREQASLARMNHDAVAKIFDAGTATHGQSFFAMELVEGLSITQHCDEHRLDLRQRIELFQRVCLGVQHAHQKGVVHRDLKPSNVLVAKVGDRHEPKLIDFGIARAIQGDDAEAGLTETGMVLGTPTYMAPEQAKADPSLVDTRTDVYALGVILYELLTGTQPLVGRSGDPESPWDLRARILAAETPRPSLRAADEAATLGLRAQQRSTAPSTWLRSMRGDLDWIVMKAMAKSVEDRYASAAELAADLGRYLRREPVQAGPPSAGYRLRKFVNRYRVQVCAVGAVVLTAVVGATVAIDQALAANANAELAQASERLASKRAGENELLAKEKAALAVAESAAKAEAQRSEAVARQLLEAERIHNEYARVFECIVRLGLAKSLEKDLYPPWPDRVLAMRNWLSEFGSEFSDQLPHMRQQLAVMREKAIPRPSDPSGSQHQLRWSELQRLRAELLWQGELGRREELLDMIASIENESTVAGFGFASTTDAYAHKVLSKLVRDLERFVGDRVIDRVRARLANAETIWSRSIDDHRLPWLRAIESIAASDAYGGMRLEPQVGLVPLGPDPDSRLWEFVHLESGSPGCAIPTRDQMTGRLVLDADVGIVFVLLPAAPGSEAKRRPMLQPFFMAKYELTEGQCERLGGDVTNAMGSDFPVTNLNWFTADRMMNEQGLCLPTIAQWSHACAGNTSTRWWTGDDQLGLVAAENVADQVVLRIGCKRANPFGLHDMAGNVCEWAADLSTDGRQRDGDGLVVSNTVGADRPMVGSWGGDPDQRYRSASSSWWDSVPAFQGMAILGMRAARMVR